MNIITSTTGAFKRCRDKVEAKLNCVNRCMAVRIRLFKRWQRNPFTYKREGFTRVACMNCGNEFEGGYCPVCGQAADTPRITARSMLLRTLDVWGLGNRSMPRTMLHLILRPGYMIADYIKGRRQPYFPPMKMLFVLGAFYLLSMALVRFGEKVVKGNESFTDVMLECVGISGGYEAAAADTTKQKAENGAWSNVPIGEVINSEDFAMSTQSGDKQGKVTIDEDSALMRSMKKIKGKTFSQVFDDVLRRTLVLRMFVLCLLYALFTKAFFRKSAECEAMNYTEMFFAQVLMFCQMLIVGIVMVLMGGELGLSAFSLLPWWLQVTLFTVNYKQMFGLGTRSALFKTVALTITVNFIVVLMIVIVGTLMVLSVMVFE